MRCYTGFLTKGRQPSCPDILMLKGRNTQGVFAECLGRGCNVELDLWGPSSRQVPTLFYFMDGKSLI